MLDHLLKVDPELLTFLVSVLGAVGTFLSLVWVRLVKPVIKVVNTHEQVVHSMEVIRKELTTNGGNSIKDAIIDLRTTCHRMETRQKVIEQRTKASLHYSQAALFETDNEGRLVWSNVNFCEFMKDISSNLEGYDWLNCIDEEDREDLLQEFKSCLHLNRKFVRITKMQNGMVIRMTGYPYRINEEKQDGFLVSVSEQKEV